MHMHNIVRLQPDFILERIDNEIAVYHPSLTTSMYFNETGALIWELCDGTRTVADIVKVLAEAFPESGDEIESGVISIVEDLVAHGIAELE